MINNELALKRLEEMDMPLCSYRHMEDYLMTDIEESMSPRQYIRFCEFMGGQTMGVVGEVGLVYKDDLLRFLAGLPAVD